MYKNFFVFSGFLFFLSVFFLFSLYDKSYLISFEVFYGCNFVFFFDFVSWLFFCMVSFVSMMVFMYSESYMHGDLLKKKFSWILFTFVLSMLLMVSSSNFFLLMLGWDGLGLSSFCLIFYFQNWKSFNSGMTTFLSNRLGDVGLIICIFWSISNIEMFFLFSCGLNFFVGLFLVICSFSKSAQIPFSSWLPLAMAAPTPVSALVHSSTLVTAGIYLIVRFNQLLDEICYSFIFFVSMITVVLAGFSSLGEMDFKKIIALSTLSHIGLMFVFISLKEFNSALMHMFMHSMFKSLLFMVAGSIIHLSISNQDLRIVSLSSLNFSESFPLLISLFSMFGSPFLSGFISKEFFLLGVTDSLMSMMLFVWLMIAICLTASYSIRMFVNLMFPSLNVLVSHGNMNSSFLWGSLFSIFLGCLVSDLIISKFLIWVSFYSFDSKVFLYFSLMMGFFLGVFSWILSGFKFIFFMWGLSNTIYSFQLPMVMVSGNMFWKFDLKGVFEHTIFLLGNLFKVFSYYPKFYINSMELIKFNLFLFVSLFAFFYFL